MSTVILNDNFFDGFGTSSKFKNPNMMCLDQTKENIFVIDNNSSIRKINISSTQTSTIAGNGFDGNCVNGVGTNSRFNLPRGITIDNNNNIYVSDTVNHLIRKINGIDRTVTTIAGSIKGFLDGVGTNSRFNLPCGLCIDETCTYLYISDNMNNKIRRLNLETNEVITIAGSKIGFLDGIGTNSRFFNPTNIIYKSNTLYVTDFGNNRLRKIEMSSENNNIVYTTSNFIGSGLKGLSNNSTSIRFNKPNGLCFDDNNNLYICDSGNNLIRKVQPNGIVSVLTGISKKGYLDGNSPRFNNPIGIVFNDGKLYVSDSINNVIRKIELNTNTTSTFIGNNSNEINFKSFSGNKYYISIVEKTKTLPPINGYFFIDNNGLLKKFYVNGNENDLLLPIINGVKNDVTINEEKKLFGETQYIDYPNINNNSLTINIGSDLDFESGQTIIIEGVSSYDNNNYKDETSNPKKPIFEGTVQTYNKLTGEIIVNNIQDKLQNNLLSVDDTILLSSYNVSSPLSINNTINLSSDNIFKEDELLDLSKLTQYNTVQLIPGINYNTSPSTYDSNTIFDDNIDNKNFIALLGEGTEIRITNYNISTVLKKITFICKSKVEQNTLFSSSSINDPSSWKLYGSNVSTSIYGNLDEPNDFTFISEGNFVAQQGDTRYYNISLNNDKYYSVYKFIFPTLFGSTTPSQFGPFKFLSISGAIFKGYTLNHINQYKQQVLLNLIDDDSSTKYINYDKLNTGFTIIPNDGASIVNSITIKSGNYNKSPSSWKLYGSNNGINGTYVLISESNTNYTYSYENKTFNLNGNDTFYTSYKLIFPNIINSSEDSMEISGVSFKGSLLSNFNNMKINLVDKNYLTKYINYDKYNTGFSVTPLSGSSIVKSIVIEFVNIANDNRSDPSSWKLYGSNNGINGTYILISEGNIPTTTRTTYETKTFYFNNNIFYTSYKVVFPNIVDDINAESIIIGGIRLNSITENDLYKYYVYVSDNIKYVKKTPYSYDGLTNYVMTYIKGLLNCGFNINNNYKIGWKQFDKFGICLNNNIDILQNNIPSIMHIYSELKEKNIGKIDLNYISTDYYLSIDYNFDYYSNNINFDYDFYPRDIVFYNNKIFLSLETDKIYVINNYNDNSNRTVYTINGFTKTQNMILKNNKLYVLNYGSGSDNYIKEIDLQNNYSVSIYKTLGTNPTTYKTFMTIDNSGAFYVTENQKIHKIIPSSKNLELYYDWTEVSTGITGTKEFKIFNTFDSAKPLCPLYLQSDQNGNYITSVTTIGNTATYTSDINIQPFENAFDNNSSTKFSNTQGVNSGGIVRLNNSLNITAISFTTANDAIGKDPTSYKLYGSDDNINFILINESIIKVVSYDRKKTSEIYHINNINSYIYYKIIFPTTISTDMGVHVSEITFYYKIKSEIKDELNKINTTSVNIGQYALDNSTNDLYIYNGRDEQQNNIFDLIATVSEFKTNLLNKVDLSQYYLKNVCLQDPTMNQSLNYITSVTAIGNASPINETFGKAFDNNSSSKFYNSQTLNSGGIVRLNNSLNITAISFTTANDAIGKDPTSYKLYGSDDNINFILINESIINLPTNRNTSSVKYYINNINSYIYYKIIFPTTVDNNSGVQISEIKLYYNDDINNALNEFSLINDIYIAGQFILDTSTYNLYRYEGYDAWGMYKSFNLVTTLNPLIGSDGERFNMLTKCPNNICFDSNDNLFVNMNGKLIKFDSNKNLTNLPVEFFNSGQNGLKSFVINSANDILYINGIDKCIYKIQYVNGNYTKSLFCGLGSNTEGFPKEVKFTYPIILTIGENITTEEFLIVDFSNILSGFKIKKLSIRDITVKKTYDAFINITTIPTIIREVDHELYKYYDFEFLGYSKTNIGPTGPQGSQGKRGPTGIIGLVGPTGVKGPIGTPNEEISPVGPFGPTGPIGPTGKNNTTPGPTGQKGKEYIWKNVYDFDTYYNNNDIYTKNNSIYQITEDSFYTTDTIAGNGTQGYKNSIGTNSKFNNPHSFAIDKYKNIYVADRGNNCVRKIEYSTKLVTTLAGNIIPGYKDGNGSDAMFNCPCGIAIDKNGENIYVSDTGNNCIRKITYNGKDYIVTTFAGNQEEGDLDDVGTTAMFNSPEGLCLDTKTNTLYVADTENNKIKMIFQNGSVSCVAGNGIPEFLDGQGTASCFNNPRDLSIDRFGNIYVADTYNNRIRKITNKGFIKSVAGSKGGYLDGIGTNALFNLPSAISIDGDDNIYVGDNSHVLRKIINNGDNYEVITFAGYINENGYVDSTNIEDVRFENISDILVDTNNTIYIADGDNNVIREIYNTKENLLIPGGKGQKGETGIMNIKEGDIPSVPGIGGEMIINETDMYICSSDGKWHKMSGLTKIM